MAHHILRGFLIGTGLAVGEEIAQQLASFHAEGHKPVALAGQSRMERLCDEVGIEIGHVRPGGSDGLYSVHAQAWRLGLLVKRA